MEAQQQASDERRGAESKLVCDQCQAQFKRKEHLVRHLLKHTGHKPHQCPLCPKAFPRRDTLQRHMSMHGADAATVLAHTQSRTTNDPVGTHQTRTTKACMQCAKSKQRCDGDSPCQRCSQRGVNCIRNKDMASLHQSEAVSGDRTTQSSSPTKMNNSTSDGGRVSPSVLRLSPSHVAASQMLLTKSEPGVNASTGWPEDDYDRFQQARAHSRRVSIAEVYEAVNNHAIPGPSIQTSIESSNQASNSAWHCQSRFPSNTSESLRPYTPASSAGRRSSIAVDQCEADIVAAEDFGHVPRIPPATYARIVEFCERHRDNATALPSIDTLNAFVQLYFEHHHSKLPLLHKATFSPSEDSWLLVLALAAVGCEYSELCSMPLMRLFEHIAMRAVSATMTFASKVESLPVIQSVVIFLSFLLYDGSEEHLLFLQHHRSLLVTTCRQLLHRREADVSSSSERDVGQCWKQWSIIEQERRVIYMVAQFECLQSVVFDIPATMVTRELIRPLPCHESLWACSNPHDWKALIQSYPGPDISAASIISAGPLTESLVQGLSDISLLLIFLILHVAEKSLQGSYELWIRPRVTALDRSDGSVIHKVLDADMQRLEADSRRRLRGDFEVSFHLLTIIRFTPFGSLCILAGLRCPENAGSAQRNLESILQDDPARARLTLLHAGRLFSHFRNLRVIPRSDLQAFLAASLYTWLWTKSVTSGCHSPEQNSPRSPLEHSIRIESGLESPDAKRWVEDGADLKAHLVGVGILAGSNAASRVLKEAARVFRVKAANSTLGRSMADSCIRVVLGS